MARRGQDRPRRPGRTYPLKATDGAQSGGALSTAYTVDAGGSPASGTWQLRVNDVSEGSTGTLNGWALTF